MREAARCKQLIKRNMFLQRIYEDVSVAQIFILCLLVLLARLLYNGFCTGLNHIPGPFLACFTDLYRLFVVWGRRPEQWHISLHKTYGDLVRIGPRTVICANNGAAKQIYALNAGFVKASFQS